MHNKTSNHFLQHAVHLQREKKFLTGIFYCSLLPSKRPTLPPQKLRRSSAVAPSARAEQKGCYFKASSGLYWALLSPCGHLRPLAAKTREMPLYFCNKNEP